MASVLFCFTFCLLYVYISGFSVRIPRPSSKWTRLHATPLENMSESQMSIDELKSELDLRSVDYEDCISKQELVQRLIESRAKGRANPDILKKFNQEVDTINMKDVDDSLLEQAKAKDGSLPGGLSPEMAKALASDPQIIQLLRDPKMQEIMQAVMTGGPEALKKYLGNPDMLMMLDRLNVAIAKAAKKN